jgi:hypothetical protein
MPHDDTSITPSSIKALGPRVEATKPAPSCNPWWPSKAAPACFSDAQMTLVDNDLHILTGKR